MTNVYLQIPLMGPEKICEACGEEFGVAQAVTKWEHGECDRCEIEGPVTDSSNFATA